MDVLVLSHQDDAGLGVFAGVLGPRARIASFAQGRPPSGDFSAAIVLGGDANVDQEAEHPWLVEEKAFVRGLIDRRVPVLGVCLGAQLLAEVAGAKVGPLAGGAEIGWHEVEVSAAPDPLMAALPPRFRAFQWHGYGFATPPGATELARGARGAQAFRLAGAPAWGIQFHAEVDAPTVESWIAVYGEAAGIDPDALRAETRRELPRWNELGRALCERFLEQAPR